VATTLNRARFSREKFSFPFSILIKKKKITKRR